MSKNRSSFLKRDREVRKREKQQAKKQRKEDRKREESLEGQAPDLDNTPGAPEDTTNDSTADQAGQSDQNLPQP